MWCWFPGSRPPGSNVPFGEAELAEESRDDREGNADVRLLRQRVTLVSSNAAADARVERRLRRHAGVEEPADPAWCRGLRVLKFGGSSLATPDCIRAVGRIVRNTLNGTPAVIVVSAFQGVTDQLLDCAGLAERRDPGY